jgi:filamentous hemagglutinin family protein
VRALTACSLLTFWPGAHDLLRAQGLPGGMNVVAGQVAARTVGNTMTVNNSPNSIINWNSFSIGAGNAVRFEQASASSQVLNRVTGNDPSAILGSLSSNGRVWLLNPNGVLFGQGARIDVAGLVTSTLNLNNADWLAGKYRFDQGSGDPAGIVNQGELRSSLGGRIALIGATVRNEGEINAPGGQVVVAAGSSVELVDSATPNVSVKLNAGAGEALNLGRLMAAGGRIDVQAATVNQNGIVRADSLSAGAGGEVVLQARDQLNLGAGSQTTANGDTGGKVTLRADQTMVHGGVGATGSQGSGGQVRLLGRQVGLLDAAKVDASGATGGGEVLVGGGQQGKDPTVPNAEAVYFGPQARIAADATQSGDGGRVILWSDKATRAYGGISARGGASGGNGGFVETSGGWLDARLARIDTSAPLGRNGSWLLDPFDVTVSDSVPATAGVGPDFTAVSDSATIRWADISTALASGTQVTVSTGAAGNTGTQAGNIAINVLSSPPVNAGTGASLTFVADGSIDINGTMAFQGASMPLSFLAGRSGQGVVRLPNTTITLEDGNITFGGFTTYNRAGGGQFQGATGYDASHPTGVDFSTADLTALGGTITLNGGSRFQGAGSGVNISNSNLLAKSIVVNGNTTDFGTTGPGISVSVATLEARQTMDMRGMGTGNGLTIGLESQLILTNSFAPASLNLFGVGQANEGVLLDGSQTPFSLVFDKTGGSVAIDGSGPSGVAGVRIVGPGTSANVIDVSGGTTLAIGGVATRTDLVNARVSANPADANGVPFTLQGSQTLTLTNSQITSGGPVTVQADTMALGAGTTITSNFAGPTAIVLQGGAGNGGIQSFNNQAGATALQVGTGSRWLVFATDLTGFNAGGLAYDFKRYNAGPNDLAVAGDVGNGLVFSVPQFATVTGTVQTKTYDGTAAATVTNLAASGVNQDQLVSIGITGAVFGSPDASTNNNVTLNGLALQFVDVTGKPVFGYLPQYLLRGGINPAPVTVAVTGVDKVYDATTQAHPVATVTSGLVGTETLGVNSFGQFPIKDAGTYPVSVDIALTDGTNGGKANNYTVAPTFLVTASITPAPLTVTGVGANNKIYDATTAAALSGTASVAGLPGDVVNLGGTPLARFSTKNVGTGIAVAVSGYALSGADAGNYTLVQPTGLAADITPATIPLQGLSGNAKVYDSTTAATYTGTPSITPLGSDVVSVLLPAGAPAFFADKNVGFKNISIPSMTLTGPDAGNYVLITPGFGATIVQLQVSPIVSVNNKVYDATTAATFASPPTAAFFPGDDVALTGGTPTFINKDVGTNLVQVTGLTFTGADAGNYRRSLTVNTTATITPATLTVNGLAAASKVYDATTATTLSGTPSITPLGSDNVFLAGTPAGNFADKNVGTAKPVSVSGLIPAGPDGHNYVLAAPAGLTADITPATLLVTGLVANNKVYDATAAATLSGTATVTPLGDDTVGVSAAPVGTFSDKNVGKVKSVAVSAQSLTGPDAGNYIPLAQGLTADITPAPLAIGGLVVNNKVYDATATATLAGTATVAALGNDALTVNGTPVAQFSDPNVGMRKNVAVSGLSLSGADAGNYTVVQPGGLSADITPATLRYVATPVTQVVGVTLPQLTGTVEGFVGGETQQSATSGALAFTTPATSTSSPGRYAIMGAGLGATNYVFVQDPANTTALAMNPPTNADAVVAKKGIDAAPRQALQLMERPTPPADPAMGGVVDLVPAPTSTAEPSTTAAASPTTAPPTEPSSQTSASTPASFEPVRVSDMSTEALASMLDARAQYKEALFADAVSQLEKDPRLADMPACRSREELRERACVVTPALKRQMQAAAAAAPAAAVTPPKASVPKAPAAPPSPPVAAAPTAPAVADGTPVELLPAVPRRVLNASLPQIQRKVALVIGVDRYEDPTIPKLANAVGDARAIGNVLESQMGYETIVLENATKKAVVTALNELAVEVGPKDSVVLYYAGHGELVEATKLGYWLLADSDAKRPETWLSNADIGRLITQIEASQVALVSDSCYSGSLVADERIRAAIGAVDPAQVLSHKSVVVMSSGGNEPVADAGKEGHSPFAWNLMNNLRQLSAWQPGGNVFERVRFAVAKELPQRPQYGAFGAGGHQGGDYLFEQRKLEPEPQ